MIFRTVSVTVKFTKKNGSFSKYSQIKQYKIIHNDVSIHGGVGAGIFLQLSLPIELKQTIKLNLRNHLTWKNLLNV